MSDAASLPGTSRSCHPPLGVLTVCLGVQILYLCSFSIAIPQSNALMKLTFSDSGHGTSDFTVKFWGGAFIGIQNIAFGFAVYFAKTLFADRHRLAITWSMVVSILGCIFFTTGTIFPISNASWRIFILMSARVVQGVGAGLDFTAKNVITALSSPDVLPTYYSYWSIACAAGSGTGPLLVYGSSFLPGVSQLSLFGQCAVPMIGLCVLQGVLFAIHLKVFPAEIQTASEKTTSNVTIPMPREQRRNKILVSVFLGFVRCLIRASWEAVCSIALETAFGYDVYTSSLIFSSFYFTVIPTQTLFKTYRKRFTDSKWMHAMIYAAATGVVLLWFGLVFTILGHRLRLVLFVLGSLLLFDGLSISATVSDCAGVKFADDSDPQLNKTNVVFWQIIAKGFIGKALGPVVGRLSVVGQWNGFGILTLSMLLLSEFLSRKVLEQPEGPVASLELELSLHAPGARPPVLLLQRRAEAISCKKLQLDDTEFIA